jgi:hypothetical protein
LPSLETQAWEAGEATPPRPGEAREASFPSLEIEACKLGKLASPAWQLASLPPSGEGASFPSFAGLCFQAGEASFPGFPGEGRGRGGRETRREDKRREEKRREERSREENRREEKRQKGVGKLRKLAFPAWNRGLGSFPSSTMEAWEAGEASFPSFEEGLGKLRKASFTSLEAPRPGEAGEAGPGKLEKLASPAWKQGLASWES